MASTDEPVAVLGVGARIAALVAAERLGLEADTVADGLGSGPLGSSWQVAKLKRIATGAFSAQFALSLALKDVHVAL